MIPTNFIIQIACNLPIISQAVHRNGLRYQSFDIGYQIWFTVMGPWALLHRLIYNLHRFVIIVNVIFEQNRSIHLPFQIIMVVNHFIDVYWSVWFYQIGCLSKECRNIDLNKNMFGHLSYVVAVTLETTASIILVEITYHVSVLHKFDQIVQHVVTCHVSANFEKRISCRVQFWFIRCKLVKFIGIVLQVKQSILNESVILVYFLQINLSFLENHCSLFASLLFFVCLLNLRIYIIKVFVFMTNMLIFLSDNIEVPTETRSSNNDIDQVNQGYKLHGADAGFEIRNQLIFCWLHHIM